MTQRNFTHKKLSAASISKFKSSSNSSSSLVKATYDLLSHPDIPELKRMLEDYIQNHRTTVSCSLNDAKLHPYHSQIKATALISFPRSGNTWLRTLVEKSTGYQTSSIYCDEELRSFRAECDRSNLFLIKTHTNQTYAIIEKAKRNYDQFIYLVRNPFDAILSFYTYEVTKRHVSNLTDFEKAISANSTKNILPLLSIKMVKPMVATFSELYHSWRKTKIPHLIIRYEDLKQSPAIILRYVNRFIVPFIVEKDGSPKSKNNPQLLYYYDDPYYFSPKQEIMKKCIQQDDEKITCAVAEDLVNLDVVYKSNKYESLHSRRYFSNRTIQYIIDRLLEPLCYFKYDILFKKDLNIPCKR